MKKATFTYILGHEPQTVTGWQTDVPGLGLYRDTDKDPWNLVHMQSGRILSWGIKREECNALALSIEHLFDWTLPMVDIVVDLPTLVEASEILNREWLEQWLERDMLEAERAERAAAKPKKRQEAA